MSESSAIPKAVIDTNVFVSGAISLSSAPHRLLQAWYDQQFLLILSDQQYTELVEVFQRPKLSALFQLNVKELSRLLSGLAVAPRVQPSSAIPVQPGDAKDAKILAAAIDGGADYLVTGDADRLVQQSDPLLDNLQVVTVAEYLTLLDERRSAAH